MADEDQTRIPEGWTPPEATLDDEALPAEPVLCKVVLDKFEPTVDFNKNPIVQHHYGVRPVGVAEDGTLGWATGTSKTGMVHTWVKYDLRAHSLYLVTIGEFGRVFGTRDENGAARPVGKHLMEGFVGYFLRELPVDTHRRVEGRKVNAKYTPSAEGMVPFRAATADEAAAVRALPEWRPPAQAVSGQPVEEAMQVSEIDYDDDELVSALIQLHDGHTLAGAARNAARDKSLSANVKKAVALGLVAKELVEVLGVLMETGDGKFVSAISD